MKFEFFYRTLPVVNVMPSYLKLMALDPLFPKRFSLLEEHAAYLVIPV